MRLCRSAHGCAHGCAQHEPCRWHGKYRLCSKCGFTADSPARSANWPLSTAVSEANETVNRGAATPWLNSPRWQSFFGVFGVFPSTLCSGAYLLVFKSTCSAFTCFVLAFRWHTRRICARARSAGKKACVARFFIAPSCSTEQDLAFLR